MQSCSEAATRNGRPNLRCVRRPLRVVTYLAPNLFWFYKFISAYLAKRLGYPMELVVGSDYAELAGHADIGFVCGLPYVEHTRFGMPKVEPLAAPVLRGTRYGGKPIYFSDVIVRRDSPFRSFAELRGRSWAYNEPYSQSGYGITRYHLVCKGETTGYFSKVIEAGSHERSVSMTCSGEVDAAAIDSHVLSVMMRDHPVLARRLRIIDTLGPSPIQPVVAGSHLPRSLRQDVRGVLLELCDDPRAMPKLRRALVERFEPVSDSTYDAIRRMRAVAEAAQFLMVR